VQLLGSDEQQVICWSTNPSTVRVTVELLYWPLVSDVNKTFFVKTKTKTLFFVLEAPRDQDFGLEDYITAVS